MSDKAYNVTATPLARVQVGKTTTGTAKIKFRASMMVRGRQVERTVVAMGKAAEMIRGKVKKGQPLAIRALFERAPANDDGKRGGEYLSVVGLPQAKAA